MSVATADESEGGASSTATVGSGGGGSDGSVESAGAGVGSTGAAGVEPETGAAGVIGSPPTVWVGSGTGVVGNDLGPASVVNVAEVSV